MIACGAYISMTLETKIKVKYTHWLWLWIVTQLVFHILTEVSRLPTVCALQRTFNITDMTLESEVKVK